MTMTIIGISFSHDGTLSVLRDGKHVFALAEERLNRTKSYLGFPFLGLRYVLKHRIIDPKEVDLVAVSANVFKKEWARTFAFLLTEDKKYYDIQNSKAPKDFFLHDDEWQKIHSDEACKSYVEKKLRALLDSNGISAPIAFYDHHQCHTASAYYAGGYDEALAVTLDGEGDLKSGSISVCKEGRVETLHTVPDRSSLGWLYSEVTRFCGFKISRHEGKITGLAAFGDYTRGWQKLQHELVVKDGSILYTRDNPIHRFADRVRMKLGLIPYASNMWRTIVNDLMPISHEDVAAVVQHALEERGSEFIKYWVDKTNIGHVVGAGGVFANVKFNQKVAELPGVESFFAYPDMGDGGNAYGAAALAYFATNTFDAPANKLQNVYLGPEFSDAEIEQALAKEPTLRYERVSDPSLAAAQLVADKKIVGWFQGRMEYGPRALGNRSILADPSDASINKWLNTRMKRTEFMPFAPSCLYEAADEVFEIEKETMKFPAEFMTITFSVRREWREKIAAVTHVDGTARPQLVRQEVNPKYYALLTEYKKLTGLPLLINTSFNVHEEPIVCKPEEAIKSLVNGVVDALVIGDFVSTKK